MKSAIELARRGHIKQAFEAILGESTSPVGLARQGRSKEAFEAVLAMEHSSPEELKQYLHDHPNADKSKHYIKEQSRDKPKDDEKGKGEDKPKDDEKPKDSKEFHPSDDDKKKAKSWNYTSLGEWKNPELNTVQDFLSEGKPVSKETLNRALREADNVATKLELDMHSKDPEWSVKETERYTLPAYKKIIKDLQSMLK